MCRLLSIGAAALFGPESGSTAGHIHSICDAFEIPHVEMRWDLTGKRTDYSLNLAPDPHAVGKVK